MNSLDVYRELAAQHPPLDVRVERALMQQIAQAPDQEVKRQLVDRLVRHNIGHAVRIVTRHVSNVALLEEAVSVAVNEMYRIARNARDEGASFYSWAAPRLRGELMDWMRRAPTVVMTKWGRQKAPAGAAPLLVMSMNAPVASSDASQAGESITVEDTLASNEGLPSDGAANAVDLEAALGSLDVRSRRIIEMYHGLNGSRPLTFEEIAPHLNLGAERVRQIEKNAMQHMRQVLMG